MTEAKLGTRALVMTGGTSGFGRRMLERLLVERPEWHVILLARRSQPSAALETWATAAGMADRLTIIPCDLASLTSVRAACDMVLASLDRPVDALVLNAGIQAIQGDQASADGFELSFSVNHLAHYLIVERLQPHVRPGGRIVITSSEVHDPAAFCLVGITRAEWQEPDALADPVRSQSQHAEIVDRGEARYCASKLMNLMHVRHLARHQRDIAVVAFNPSVVPGTDIARERNVLQILGWKYIMPVLAPVLPGARTMARSAGDLLWLLTEADAASMHGQYVNGRTPEPGSADSRDMGKIDSVIAVSRRLVSTRFETVCAASP